MGLLDRLIRKTTEKVADKVAEKVVTDIVGDKLKDAFGNLLSDDNKKPTEEEACLQEKAEALAEEIRSEVYGAKDPYDMTGKKDYYTPDNGACEEYFSSVLTEAFPALSLYKNVPLKALVSRVPRKYMDVSILLRKEGEAAAALLLVEKNRWNSSAVEFTMAALKEAGVTPLRFMVEFSNKKDYVVSRVESIL